MDILDLNADKEEALLTQGFFYFGRAIRESPLRFILVGRGLLPPFVDLFFCFWRQMAAALRVVLARAFCERSQDLLTDYDSAAAMASMAAVRPRTMS